MEYLGYRATVAFDEEANTLHGEVINARGVITFQGDSVEDLLVAFKDSVDDYLKFCIERGLDPGKPCSGRISLRVTPDIHSAALSAATSEGKSLNAWIADTVEKAALR